MKSLIIASTIFFVYCCPLLAKCIDLKKTDLTNVFIGMKVDSALLAMDRVGDREFGKVIDEGTLVDENGKKIDELAKKDSRVWKVGNGVSITIEELDGQVSSITIFGLGKDSNKNKTFYYNSKISAKSIVFAGEDISLIDNAKQ